MLKIEVVDHFDKFLHLEPIWNDLLSRSDMNIPFMTFEWFSCWWKSYGNGKEIFVLLVKEDDEILGIAPLMKTKIRFRGLPIRAITCIANEQTNRVGFILINKKKEVVSLILKHLITLKSMCDLLILDYIEEGSFTDKYLTEAIDENQIKCRKIHGIVSPYISISGDWNNFLKERSKSFRKKLKRTKNLIERTGDYEIIKYSTDNVQKGIEEMLTVSRKSWQYRSKTAIANNREETEFYRSLAESASLKGWFNLWIFKVNSEPIAFEYKFIYNGKSYSVKTSYDEEYRKLSPSVFLDGFTIKDSFENGHEEYDLLGTNDKYKMGLTALTREHCNYWIFGDNAYAKMLSFLELNIVASIKKATLLRRLFRLQKEEIGHLK